MYTLRKVCPMIAGLPKVYEMGTADTEGELFEVLRGHLLDVNETLLSIDDLPEAIRELAEASINHNAGMVFALTPNGTVWIDGVGPDMDSYTIT